MDEQEVLGTVDVSVLHELQVFLVDTTLDRGWHGIRKDVSFLTLLYQSLESR